MDSADKARKDFFISYTGADEQIASWIAFTLEEADYGVVFQAWDMRQAGKSVIGNIDQAAKECARTIAVVSPEYFASKFTVPEWQTAVHSDPTGEKGLLIPVIVRPHEIDGVMKPLAYISFIGLDEEQAETALLEGVRRDTRFKPATKPAYTLNRSKKKPRFPGTLPPVCNRLSPPNPNFSGREKLLLDLRESLAKGQKTALHGLGGIGKTQLAIEYAYRHSASYELIWWIRSEEPSTLASDYAALALELNLPEKEEASQAVVVQAVTRWLEHSNQWLLVFDNARDATSIKPYLPRSASGHVLITSRNPDWRSVVNPLQVEVWERNESVAFLLKRTGRTDEPGANALAEALGDLPLALEQAAAYCDNKKRSFADYLKLFNTRRTELWHREKAPEGYKETVATTWSLAFEEIRKVVPMAEELLSLCSIVAPDAIPRTLLDRALAIYTGGENEEASVDEFVIDEAYEALRSYSLITLNEKFVTVHRLVQSVVRDGLSEEALIRYRDAMLQALGEQFPQEGDSEPSSWPECEILLPHAQTVLEDSQDDHDEAWGARCLMLIGMGLYHLGKVEYAEAEPLLRRSLVIMEKQLGSEHWAVATNLDYLGLVLQGQGKYQEAAHLFLRALGLFQKQHGFDHPYLVTSLNYLAGLLYDQGKYTSAELLLRRALKVGEMQLGPHHSDVATSLNNLARVLQDQGEYREAEPLLRRALKVGEMQLGPHHSNVAMSLNNLARVLQDQGEYEEAEPLLRRAFDIMEKQLGEKHPLTRKVKANLDKLLQMMQSDNE